MTASVELKKITGRESQGTCRQDELIGGRRKVTLTLTRTGLDAVEISFVPSGNRNQIPSTCFKVLITKVTAPFSDVACCKPSKQNLTLRGKEF
jgi:hypothetical protein